MKCCLCGGLIDPVYGWDAAHTVPHAWGGNEVLPAHIKCHREQTATETIPQVAKAKRVEAKHYGIKRKGWGGRWRKKMNGEVVPR